MTRDPNQCSPDPSSIISPDPNLVAEGWELRFIADESRAREAENLYQELGFEVRTEAVHRENLEDTCEGCRPAVGLFFMIYTRKQKA